MRGWLAEPVEAKFMKRQIFLSFLFFSTAAAYAQEKLYADSSSAHIGPRALAELHKLRLAGVTELLVPTWFPDDLQNVRVKSLDTQVGRFGPSLNMVWPSSRGRRSLLVQGGTGGFGGPGPDRTMPVENPTVRELELWVNIQSPMAWKYCTDWIPVRGSMPSFPNDRKMHLLYSCDGREAGILNPEEMKQILSSLRYYRIP